MFAAEMLAARDKMIDAVQVNAVLARLGISADIDWIRAALNELAEEQPPRLIRANGTVSPSDGRSELLFWFVLPPPADDGRS
jgi:hypothetical protein